MWKIGELARRTGLTVRTLHHYDEIGLLSPAERSDGGHRVYGEADVQRLYRIVSLRCARLPARRDRRRRSTRRRFDPRAAVDDHLARLEAQIAQQQQLLEHARGGCCERLDADDFLTTIEELTMRERYYTPEQLDQLEQRRQALGEDAISDVEREWARDLRHPARRDGRGHRPRRPAAAPARRARAASCVAMFTGGDPGIRGALKKM